MQDQALRQVPLKCRWVVDFKTAIVLAMSGRLLQLYYLIVYFVFA